MGLKKNLAYNIKLMRTLKNASLEEFADEIGIGRTTLYSLEKEEGNTTIDTIEQIAKNLSISPLSLLSRGGEMEHLKNAEVMLESLQCLSQMSEADRIETLMLVNRLAGLLHKYERSNAEEEK